MDVKEFLKSKKIWLGTTVADMNQQENHFNLKELIEEYTELKLKLLRSSLQLPYKDEKLIENMCFSFRHDYGLLPKLIQEDLRRDCKDWLRAYENNK